MLLSRKVNDESHHKIEAAKQMYPKLQIDFSPGSITETRLTIPRNLGSVM